MEKLIMYLQYPFVRYALIVGMLIALCSSLLGVTLVLKRFSFIGDGLSHVAFGAIAIASVMNLTNKMLLVLPVTVVCAILLLKSGQNARIKGDAAIAMISVGALAFGYLLMNVFGTSSNLSGDVCSTLFGSTSILTLTSFEVWLCIILSAFVVVMYVLFYNKIFAVTFDENFASAVGTRVDRYNLLIATIIAIIIVLAMNLVGSLLISALIIFPALSAMRLFKSFRKVTVFSAVISVVCALAGIIISILAGTPVGSTIVAVDVVVFAICAGIGGIFRHRNVIALLLVSVLLAGCGANSDSGSEISSDISSEAVNEISNDISNETVDETSSDQVDTSVDIDLTVMSSTVVYSEVFQMMVDPESYVGKTVKMNGLYDVYTDESTGKTYHACIIQDATACCAQGIEFALEDAAYPESDILYVTVKGTFSLYEENGTTYCTLSNAELLSSS